MANEVVIVEAVRAPVGRRNGGLAGMHSIDLLGAVQRAVVERAGVDPREVGQVVGGCVGQAGMQAANVTRNAWLAAGLPLEAAATTVDAQCGSSQQATNLAVAMVAAGVVWGLTRDEIDAFGKQSQDRAIQAWAEGRFEAQIVPIDAPTLDEASAVTGTQSVRRDEGLRETTLEKLASLKPVLNRVPAFHTAGTSSHISDGAAAVLVTTQANAARLGLTPRARVVDTCLMGSDPVLMLTGPIPATQHLLARNGLTIDDIDVFEINEAFASVVLAWQQEVGADPERVNPNGGAIALGHPLGGTGAILLTKALHELERRGGRYAIVTMCCGGGLGTGTLIERL